MKATALDTPRTGPAHQVLGAERTVEAARTTYDPEAALARTVGEDLGVRVTHAKPALGETPGVGYVDAALTTADAMDVEKAVADYAHRLLDAHPDLDLGARRAMALGMLARGEQATGITREVVIYTHHRPNDGPGSSVSRTSAPGSPSTSCPGGASKPAPA